MGDDNLYYQSCTMIGNIIHVYYGFYSKKDQKSRYYVHTYNDNFEPMGNLREVMTVGGRKKSETGDIYREVSSDSTKILIVGEDDFKDEDKQRFKIGVFDYKMEKIWGKDIELPYTDKLFRVNNFIVDAEGNVYILGKKFEEKSVEKRKGEVNYTYEIMVFKQDGSTMQKSFTLGKDDFIKEITMTVSNKVIEIFGFYGDFTYRGELINGFFTFSFDENLNQKTKTQNEFSKTLSDEACIYKKNGRPILFNFFVKTIIKKADGSTLILAEHKRFITTSKGGYYADENILCINIDEKYEIKDIKHIKKIQLSTINDYTHSFTTYSYDNTTYLIYNDKIKNKDIIGGKKVNVIRNGANAALFAVKSDENGNLSKKLIYEKHPDKLVLYPVVCKQINSNETLIFAKKGQKYALGILSR